MKKCQKTNTSQTPGSNNTRCERLPGTHHIKKVDKIFHLADVHIRTLKRHEEYKSVFQRLRDSIYQQKTENSLIVISGDVVHAKTEMSPELIVMVSDFFRQLASQCHTVVIPGNHDCNLNNRDRLDALSPIVDNIKLPTLHYVKESRVFCVGQCAFSHFSQMDSPDNWIEADEIPDCFKKIALFHGIVDNAKTDTGFTLSSDDVNARTFKGYDAGMLGDIHKRQFVDVAKKVAYSGSLIQQNHGETFENHGYVLWDVETMKPEFIDVHNDYGYFTLKVKRGAVPLLKRAPKKPRFRVQVSDTPASEKKRVIADIQKFYDPDEITFNRSGTLNGGDDNDGINGLDSYQGVEDVLSVEHQSKLIRRYIKSKYDVEEPVLKELDQINYHLNKSTIDSSTPRNIQWNLKRFEFSNMFSFGENNVIDFTKMNGIMGLFAPNASGKSSILDAISFCLFDKCSRTYKSSKILNNKSDAFYCKATIEINGVEYVIERSGKRSYGRVPVDVKFYKNTDGQMVDLSGNQRRDTNANIREYIGEYEDFVMTALSTQGGNTVFIEKSQSERKDTLSRFIGIDVFDDLHSAARSEIRDVKSMLKKYEKDDLSARLADAETRYEENSRKYNTFQQSKKKLERKKEELEKKILKQTRHIKTYVNGAENLDIEKLKKTLQTQKARLDECAQKRNDAEIKKREKQQPLEGYRAMLSGVDAERIKSRYRKMKQWISELDEYKRKKSRLESQIENLEKSIDQLKEYDFDPNCEFCVKRNKKDAANLDRKQNKLKDLQGEMKTVCGWIESHENDYNRKKVRSKFKKVSKWEEKVSEFESKVSKWENKVNKLHFQEQQYQTNIKENQQKIQQYNKAKKEIERRKKAEVQISRLENEVSDVRNKLTSISSDIQECHSNIKIAEKDKDRIQENMKEYGRLSQKYQAYDYYLEAVKRDGVPYELIDKMMPQIEEEVNNILSQIVDFGLNIELDGKNINAYITYTQDESWALEIASNFERFVSGLAIRVALTNIANLPCPNFLAIDEGFSVADGTNLNNMNLLFDHMKTQFEFVVIISHLDMMRDMVNGLVEITNGKDEDFSSVTYV